MDVKSKAFPQQTSGQGRRLESSVAVCSSLQSSHFSQLL